MHFIKLNKKNYLVTLYSVKFMEVLFLEANYVKKIMFKINFIHTVTWIHDKN